MPVSRLNEMIRGKCNSRYSFVGTSTAKSSVVSIITCVVCFQHKYAPLLCAYSVGPNLRVSSDTEGKSSKAVTTAAVREPWSSFQAKNSNINCTGAVEF